MENIFGKFLAKFFRALPLLCALSLAACLFTPPDLPPLPANAVILAFGDSLTAGTGSRAGYPERLAKHLGRKVVNAGIRGEQSGAAKRRFAGALKQHRPNLVIVCTGGNDILRRKDDTQIAANLRAIVEEARRADVPVVLVAVPRFSLFPRNHPIYEEIADDYGLWLEDSVMKTVLHDDALKSDHVHPNDAGYQQIADAIHALLQRAGAV